MAVYFSREHLVVLFLIKILIQFSSIRAEETCAGLEKTDKLKYEIGKSYYYKYTSKSSWDWGAPFPRINPVIKISGTVILTRLSDCEFVIGIENFNVVGQQDPFQDFDSLSDKNTGGKFTIAKSESTFKLNSGLIQSINFDPTEDVWIHNIKRGILTMVQNRGFSSIMANGTTHVEASIFGDCETKYYKEFLEKQVNLTFCENGESSELLDHAKEYHLEHTQNAQLYGIFRPTKFAHCEFSMSNGLIAKSKCIEFYSHPADASFDATLEYSNKMVASVASSSEQLAKLSLNSTIHYDDSIDIPEILKTASETKIREVLKRFSTEDYSVKSILYSELKKNVERAGNLEIFLGKDVLVDATVKKFFYDALADVVTDEAIRVLSNLAVNGELDQLTQMKFFENIAFVSDPGITSLTSITSILKSSSKILKQSSTKDNVQNEEVTSNINILQQLLLGAGGLAYRFCQAEDECANIPEYVSLVDQISEHAVTAVGKAETDDVTLASVHALGNVEHLTTKAVDKLITILQTEGIPEWIYVPGIEAFRRDPCQEKFKVEARKILADANRSHQIRIYSYLGLIKCLDPKKDLETISEVLKIPDSPVSIFIGSHVRFVNSSSSPSKPELKEAVSQIELPIATEARDELTSSASRYIEYSSFNDEMNIGGSISGIAIFPTGSNKPSFLSIQGTIDVYGKSFSIEIGLSQRLRKVETSSPEENEANWCCFYDALMSKDSYLRLFDTTITLNLESLQQSVQSYFTKETGKTDGKPSWMFNSLDPNTFLEDDVTFPTIGGIPLSYELNFLKFDSFQLSTSSKDGMGLSNLFSFATGEWDLKGTLHRDSSLDGIIEMNLGSNCPVSVGVTSNGIYNQYINIGFEVQSKKSGELIVKILFPKDEIFGDQKFASIYPQSENLGIENVDDKGYPIALKQFIEHVYKNNMYCFTCETLGLKFCYDAVMHRNLFYQKSALLKSESKMEGFELTIKYKNELQKEVKIKTPGSSINREFKFSLNLKPTEQSMDTIVEAVTTVGKRKDGAKLTLQMKQPAAGTDALLGGDFTFLVERLNEKLLTLDFVQPTAAEMNAYVNVYHGIATLNASLLLDLVHFNPKAHVSIPILGFESNLDIFNGYDASENTLKHFGTLQIIRKDGKGRDRKNEVTNTSLILNTSKLSLDVNVMQANKGLLNFRGNLSAKVSPTQGNGVNRADLVIGNAKGNLFSANFKQINLQGLNTFRTELDLTILHKRSPSPYKFNTTALADWNTVDPSNTDAELMLNVYNSIKGLHPRSIFNNFRMEQVYSYKSYKVIPINEVSGNSTMYANDKVIHELVSGASFVPLEEYQFISFYGISKEKFTEKRIDGRIGFPESSEPQKFSQRVNITGINTLNKDKSILGQFDFDTNRTLEFHDWTDFQWIENGKFDWKSGPFETEYGWRETFDLHPNQIRFTQNFNGTIGPNKNEIIQHDIDFSATLAEQTQKVNVTVRGGTTAYTTSNAPSASGSMVAEDDASNTFSMSFS